MEQDFKSNFLTFYKKFQGSISEISYELSVINASIKQINQLYRKLIDYNHTCAQMIYLSNKTVELSIPELTLPLQAPEHLSLQKSVHYFAKAPEKDRYGLLIKYFIENTIIFSQFSYILLLSPINFQINLASTPGYYLISEDDSKYFCYHTFPALFNYFFSDSDAEKGMNFIYQIIRLHFWLHGPRLQSCHKFILDLVTSFFFCCHPNHFFEVSIHPFLPDLLVLSSSIKDSYAFDQGNLVALNYWNLLTTYVVKIVDSMIETTVLFPKNARKLSSMIISIDSDFPLGYIFIIEAMINRYLEQFSIFAPADHIFHDICSVFRAFCPSEYIHFLNPSPIHPIDKESLPLRSLISTIANQAFEEPKYSLNSKQEHSCSNTHSFPNLLSKSLSPEQKSPIIPISPVPKPTLSSSLSNTEKHSTERNERKIYDEFTLVTLRDLTILFKAAFLGLEGENTDKEKFRMIKSLINGLNPPQSQAMTTVMEIRSWGSIPKYSDFHFDSYRIFEDFADVSQLLNLNSIPFDDEKEMRRMIIEYAKESAPIDSLIRLSLQSFNEDKIMQANRALETNLAKIAVIQNDLMGTLQEITNAIEIQNSNNQMVAHFYIRNDLKPAISPYMGMPVFIPDKANSEQISKTIGIALGKLDQFISSNSLSEIYSPIFRYYLFERILTNVEKIFDFQEGINLTALEKYLSTYLINNKIIKKSPTLFAYIKGAANLFTLISPSKLLNDNLDALFLGGRMIGIKDASNYAYAISSSANAWVFAFGALLNGCFHDESIIKSIFSQEEIEIINNFTNALELIKRYNTSQPLNDPLEHDDV